MLFNMWAFYIARHVFTAFLKAMPESIKNEDAKSSLQKIRRLQKLCHSSRQECWSPRVERVRKEPPKFKKKLVPKSIQNEVPGTPLGCPGGAFGGYRGRPCARDLHRRVFWTPPGCPLGAIWDHFPSKMHSKTDAKINVEKNMKIHGISTKNAESLVSNVIAI